MLKKGKHLRLLTEFALSLFAFKAQSSLALKEKNQPGDRFVSIFNWTFVCCQTKIALVP
jgi:hypothetical protein